MLSEDPQSDEQAAREHRLEAERDTEKEIDRLRGVATSELSGHKPGDFLRAFLKAFARADYANSRILLLPMQLLEKKYQLEDRFTMLQQHKTIDRSPGEPGLT